MRAIAAAPWDLDCEGKEKEGGPALRASMFITQPEASTMLPVSSYESRDNDKVY